MLLVQTLYAEPGWRSGYRAGLEILDLHGAWNKRGQVSQWALSARRGSNPFPGAILLVNFE